MSYTTPIDYIFIEGPDCSGKTTLYGTPVRQSTTFLDRIPYRSKPKIIYEDGPELNKEVQF